VESTGQEVAITVTVVGDDEAWLRWLESQRTELDKIAAVTREFEAAVGLTSEQLVTGFKTECPEVGSHRSVDVMADAIAAAQRGHRGWDAVRAGMTPLPRRDAIPPHVIPRQITIRRTPSSGRPRATRRRVAVASRGSPRSEDDEPEPPRAVSAICRGCGDQFVPSRPDQRHCKGACRVLAHRRREHVTPLERYQEEVWAALESGDLDGEEALDLLTRPRPRILAMLNEVGSA
jgi:hypothetical protein